MRHRYQSTVLSSVASSQQGNVLGHSSSGRSFGASAGGNNASRSSNTSSSQQQQQAGFKKGPAGMLVGLWKVLTSYLQVRTLLELKGAVAAVLLHSQACAACGHC
jgi:hypothetical protein